MLDRAPRRFAIIAWRCDSSSHDPSHCPGDVLPQWPVPSHGMNVQVMFNAAQMLPQPYAAFFILRV